MLIPVVYSLVKDILRTKLVDSVDKYMYVPKVTRWHYETLFIKQFAHSNVPTLTWKPSTEGKRLDLSLFLNGIWSLSKPLQEINGKCLSTRSNNFWCITGSKCAIGISFTGKDVHAKFEEI